MFELTLAYVKQADRERTVSADLRRRQILTAAVDTVEPISPRATSIPRRTAGTRAPAVER